MLSFPTDAPFWALPCISTYSWVHPPSRVFIMCWDIAVIFKKYGLLQTIIDKNGKIVIKLLKDWACTVTGPTFCAVMWHTLFTQLTDAGERETLRLHTRLLLNVILSSSANQIQLRGRGRRGGLILERLPARREKRDRLCLPPHPAPSPAFRLGPNPLSWLFLSLQPFLYSIIKTQLTTCCLFH